MCGFLLVPLCANSPSVIHVSTNETLLDGYNWESTPFHIDVFIVLASTGRVAAV